MSNEYIFITRGENAGNLKKVTPQEAQEMKSAGNGHVMNMTEYRKLEERATTALNAFKSIEKTMKHSEDPRHGTPEVRDFVIKEAEKKLAAEIAAIDSEWDAKKAELVEQARQTAATHAVNVSSLDNAVGQQLASRYALELASAPDAHKQTAVIEAMTKDIARLNDSQRTALQPHLLMLTNVAKEGVNVSGVFRAASAMQSPELSAVAAAEALPLRASGAYHTLRLVKDSIKRGGLDG